MSQYTEDTANELADKALAEAEAVGDGKIVDQIGELLGASSQSLQEAYLTAVRVRRAESRARELLAESARKRGETPSPDVSEPTLETATPVQADEAAEESKPKRKGW